MSDTGNDASIPSDPGEISSEIGELETKMRDTRAWAADTAGQERVRQLYEAQEAGGVEPQEPGPGSERRQEIEEMMKDADGVYWHDQELQDEYRSLLEADSRGLSEEMTSTDMVQSWADHLDVTPEAALDGFERAQQIEDELGGNTGELMTAFGGLPDRVQWVCRRALAAPEMRIELIQGLSDEDYNQLGGFLDAMTPKEHRAVEKALGL